MLRNYTQYSQIIIMLTVYTHDELMLFMTHQTHRMCSWYISLQTCGQSISERNREERWLKEAKVSCEHTLCIKYL